MYENTYKFSGYLSTPPPCQNKDTNLNMETGNFQRNSENSSTNILVTA